MTFQDAYRRIAARIFNTIVDPQLGRFQWIRRDLKRANMQVMLREYVSICFLNAALAFAVSLYVSLFLLNFLLGKPMIVAAPLSVIISLCTTLGALVVSFEYPATRANERQRNIDNNLPFACLYMNTIAGTGAPPYLIFKFLSEFKEYGELAVEAQEIVEDVEVMGQDIEVALKRVAEHTPSLEFRDLLWGMITTIVRGGDLKTLLQEKSTLLMDAHRRKMDAYTADVGMYIEIYITLVIVGSIFSIVMMTIMGAISGFLELKALQQVIVYVFLPMASIVFIALLKLSSPIA